MNDKTLLLLQSSISFERLCFSVFQSPLVSWNSRSTAWCREEWALCLSVKSNTTGPSLPPSPGWKTTESCLKTAGTTRTCRCNLIKLFKKKKLFQWNTIGFACRFEVGKESLTIDDVTDEDEGTYTCVTTTILDEDSASARLTVVGKCSLCCLLSQRIIEINVSIVWHVSKLH